MSDNQKTCADPYVESFTQSFADANYKPATIKAYRQLVHKLGRLMDDAGLLPSALTPDLAEQLARTVEPGPDNGIRFFNLARRFAQHLIDIGVVEPTPLTEAQSARRELLADYETYLVKQRGLSPRSIPHALGFANRFLEHRFGNRMIDLTRLRAADITSFVQYVLARRTPYRDKTVTSHLRTFFQYLFARGANGDQPRTEHPQGGPTLGCATAPAPVARWGGGRSRLGKRKPPAWRA